MKQHTIPKEEQIKALVQGSIYVLLKEYLANPQIVDFRKYISVTRADLEAFLSQNPQVAETYFQKYRDRESIHEVQMIEKVGSLYKVYEMDHSMPRFERSFSTLYEAVAEHILRSHGLY